MGQGREPESKWMDRELLHLPLTEWRQMATSAVVRRGRDPGFVITTMVVINRIFN